MKNNAVKIVKEMGLVFVRKYVPRSAAALSYYLTISIFPFLICVSAIIGSLHMYESNVFMLLEDIVPAQAFSTITDIFGYVSENNTKLMFAIGLIAMLTSSSAAFRSFLGIMGEIQGEMRFKGIWRGVFSFLISIFFLAVMYVSALLLLSGGWLMEILETYFGLGRILKVWTWVRFIVLFLMLFGVIYGMYMISAPKETKRTHRLPGAIAASVVLVAASIIYSRMISVSIKYAILYGSLASFIILMIWFYTCSIILIMGNVLNVTLQKIRET